MSEYWRPIPETGGACPLAGGWARFSRVELLSRNAPPRVLPASDVPGDVMDRLTSPRPPVMGLAMDRPRLMGIVNVTPDSFSDGGRHDSADAALAHARQLLADGADILDIGGESTRPGSLPVPAAQEIARTAPVIAGLADARVSIDSRNMAVAQAAVAAGAGLVNDVSAMTHDPGMAAWLAGTGLPVCLMHAKGDPETMHLDPRYDDALLDVYDALAARMDAALAAGIAPQRLVLDPGIGFGKTMAHNLAILRRLSLFHALGCTLLLGVSRKRFIGTIGDAPEPDRRMPGTLALTLAAVAQGVQIHRVHDVAAIRQGLSLWQAVTNEGE